jgi:hypothetical protein
MPETDKLYVPAAPGDVITAEAWNEMQSDIYDDIRATSQAAAEALARVERAGDAEKLDGQTPDELADSIVDRVLDQLREHRGYLKVFKVLTVGETKEIKHGFGDCPVVDVYQLDYFHVVCSEDDGVWPSWATFYLYHSSEKKIRYPAGDGHPKGILEIEPKDPPVYKIPFRVLLEKYKVEYTSTSSLGDLETEFWQALFKAPNDELDDEQYCHSPWFHRCCREEKSVRQLKESGDWDEIWFQMRPRKTINFPIELLVDEPSRTWQLPKFSADLPTPAPTQIEVAQLDLDTVGLTLLDKPVYPPDVLGANADVAGSLREQLGEDVEDELKVMVILKC